MLKREVDKFRANNASKKSLSQTLFPSSSPSQVVSNGQTRPLSLGSANVQPRSAGHGLKRSASGLAKALPTDDGFEEPPQMNVKPQKNGTASQPVYFDENDFDSDIDLDVEDPGTKGQIKYPELPKISPTNISPTLPRRSAHLISTADSGYGTQLVPSAQAPPTHHIRSTPDEQLLPWSSSPPEHLQRSKATKTPVWHQYAYSGKSSKAAGGGIDVQTSRQANAAQRSDGHYKPSGLISTIDEDDMPDDKPPPSKRRTLPWLQQEAEETTANTSRKLKPMNTPRTKKSDFPWNTTASAIKEQQKQLRQANKKLVRNNEATDSDKLAAVASRKAKQVHRVFLSEEQQHVLELVVEKKKSVFFTGSAGTGKSVLLREIIAALRKKYLNESDRVAVTASTGLAACNIGGVTLHSFAGIGLGKEDVPTLAKKIRRNQKAKHRWMRTKVLVVDEVSMVDGELFDKLEELARTLRNNGRPFGGIQLVITGDFFQLPPVPDYKDRAARFAFEAGTWKTCIEHTIGLHHVFRQKDPEFATMLNEMREGRMSSNSIARFRTLNRPLRFEDELEATELFPTRSEVDFANASRMRNLQGELKLYEARDGGTIVEKQFRDKLLQNCMAPEVIQLKKGAQVMLIKNIDDTLVNGSLGKVIGFMSEGMFDNYQSNEEEYYATQGAGEANEEDGDVPGLRERKMKLKELAAANTQVYPVVRFAIADGSTRDLLCQRESWKIELPSGEVQASRAQIPLILAWALSIHKAQGQTLERVKVDLGRVFEKGQAYVALSRATSIKGLQVLNFSASKVMAHEKVRAFYAALSRVELASEDNKSAGKADMSVKKKNVLNASGYEQAFVEGDRYLDEEWEV